MLGSLTAFRQLAPLMRTAVARGAALHELYLKQTRRPSSGAASPSGPQIVLDRRALFGFNLASCPEGMSGKGDYKCFNRSLDALAEWNALEAAGARPMLVHAPGKGRRLLHEIELEEGEPTDAPAVYIVRVDGSYEQTCAATLLAHAPRDTVFDFDARDYEPAHLRTDLHGGSGSWTSTWVVLQVTVWTVAVMRSEDRPQRPERSGRVVSAEIRKRAKST
eukprot:1931302-Prymnesium_polylepis.1